MRLVFDTDSKGWKTFLKALLFFVIWALMIIISTVISKHIDWDPDFFQGFWTAVLIYFYIEL